MISRIVVLIWIMTIISCVNNPMLEEEENFAIEADQITSQDPLLLKQFYQDFEEWTEVLPNENQQQWSAEGQVNNFVVFSEDGLIMKDLEYHSTVSCKEQILVASPATAEQKWMYISLVSQVNKRELLAILTFLEKQEIAYRFARDEDLVPE